MINHLVTENYIQKGYSDAIYSLLPQEIKEKFEFFSVSSHPGERYSLEKLPNTDSLKVVFDYADEWHSFPSYLNRKDVVLILKEYAPFNYGTTNKVIPLPVVFNHRIPKEQKSIKDRNFSFFSSMWLTESRQNTKKILSKFESDKRFVIRWNEKFGSGMSLDEYDRMMYDSVITICPSGYMSPEVAKINEALISGNIIITSERPNYPFYDGNAFFIYKNELEIPGIIEKILSMKEEDLQKIVDDGNSYYKTKYSPSAIADVIASKLSVVV